MIFEAVTEVSVVVLLFFTKRQLLSSGGENHPDAEQQNGYGVAKTMRQNGLTLLKTIS